MSDVNDAMDESESILRSLYHETVEAEEKKDPIRETEINENEKPADIEKKDKSSDLNKLVDQISVRLPFVLRF